MADVYSAPPTNSGHEFKDLVVVLPLLSTTVAISWEVGTSYVSGGFYYFSLSEHLVSAVGALPLALIAATFVLLCFAPIRNTLRYRWLGTASGRHWFGFGLIILGVLIGALGFNIGSVFVFTVGTAGFVLGVVSGATDFSRSDAISLILAAVLGSALPFAAGLDFARFALTLSKENPSVIKLKSGTIAGSVEMAGDRGLLIYRPETETFLFVRNDDLVSVEYKSPTRKR